MRKEIIEFAKSITDKTPLKEAVGIAETIEEMNYLLKVWEAKHG